MHKSYFRIKFIGRLDSWNMTWPEVEELKYEIQTYNLDVKLWESFSNLERQDAFDFPDNQQEEVFLPLEGGEFVF